MHIRYANWTPTSRSELFCTKMRRSGSSFDITGFLRQFPPLRRHRSLHFQSNRASFRFCFVRAECGLVRSPGRESVRFKWPAFGFLKGEAFERFWFGSVAFDSAFVSRAQSIIAHVLPFGLGSCGHRPLMAFVPYLVSSGSACLSSRKRFRIGRTG